MSSAQSPEQIKASGAQLVKLLEGKINALGDQYSKGMGVTKNGLELLSPGAQKIYSKVLGDGQQPGAAPATTRAPTGGALTYDPSTGTFH
jgi:hypothetical protein